MKNRYLKDKSHTFSTKTLHIKELVIKDLNIKTKQKVAVFEQNQGGKRPNQYFIVNYDVGDYYEKEQLEDVINRLREENNPYFIYNAHISDDFKQLFVRISNRVGNELRGKNIPIKELYLHDRLKTGTVSIGVYKLYVYRYDCAENDIFTEVVFEHVDSKKNRIENCFYLPYKDDSDFNIILEKFKELYENKKYNNEIKKFFYRYFTSNKTNDYKGYDNLLDIPKSARETAVPKLTRIIDFIEKNGPFILEENALGNFLGGLAYYNEVIAANDIIKETTSKWERSKFEGFYDRFMYFFDELKLNSEES